MLPSTLACRLRDVATGLYQAVVCWQRRVTIPKGQWQLCHSGVVRKAVPLPPVRDARVEEVWEDELRHPVTSLHRAMIDKENRLVCKVMRATWIYDCFADVNFRCLG